MVGSERSHTSASSFADRGSRLIAARTVRACWSPMVCDLSLPTIYRRLELLEEHDLVDERTTVAEDGNHYNIYECNFDSTVIQLEDEEYKVRIYRRENLPDRFTQLWDDLGAE